MLPRGDGAGQHLCEGDLGYKQTASLYFGVPNKRAARLLILGTFSFTSRLLGSMY